MSRTVFSRLSLSAVSGRRAFSEVSNIADLATFRTFVESGPSVSYFTASWCGPCRQIAPVYSELAKANGEIKFSKIDIDEAKDIAEKMKIRSVPTFFFFGKDGKLAFTFSGADTKMLEEGLGKIKSE